MTLSEPTKSTRDWLRAHEEIKGHFKKLTKGMSQAKRRAAMFRAASFPNSQPKGPRASLKVQKQMGGVKG